MRRVIAIKDDLSQIQTVEDLTKVFESIASMHIAKIRGKVVASKSFFADLWEVYSSLRVDPKQRLRGGGGHKAGRSAAVIITAEGKFGGGMNDKIIQLMLDSSLDVAKTDIVAIGTYGAIHLKRHHGMAIKRVFALPPHDTNINVSAVIRELEGYEHISAFYQTYDSLRSQKVAHIDLLSAVRDFGKEGEDKAGTVNEDDYIFEPDIQEIADYMESVMLGVALTQVIMESKLAGYANRYNTMSMAKKRAGDLVGDFRHEYYRAKRGESDERLKESIKARLVFRGGMS